MRGTSRVAQALRRLIALERRTIRLVPETIKSKRTDPGTSRNSPLEEPLLFSMSAYIRKVNSK